jgi:hypothetical protein
MGNRLKKLKLVAKRTCAGLTIYKNTYGTDNMTFFFARMARRGIWQEGAMYQLALRPYSD